MDNTPDFERLFADKLKERGYSLKRISELSGVAVKHLENLVAGRFHDLPPAPYLRGYLVTLGRVLDFDGEAWWESLRTQGLLTESGRDDELPKNRFAREPLKKKILIFGALAILLLYLGVRLPKILGEPMLLVSAPDQELIRVKVNRFTVRGTARDADRLTINGEAIAVDARGAWEKEISLNEGLNTVPIVAKKFLGREKTVVRQIFYEPPEEGVDAP